ncbi:MAG: NAD(P)H-binding protein [Xenococcaceae cyanobacterium MO_167.B27]|nr:NAD(P)H-binding protein [Xenococcaceae cyanobacterium MO_167.B27]
MNHRDLPRVLVAGGTGYIGGGVLKILQQQGFWVRALCRAPHRLREPSHCDDIFVGQVTRPSTLKGLCQGIDVVFSSIGTRSLRRKPTFWEVDYQGNLNLLEAAKQENVKHFIFVSVVRGSEMARLSPIAEAREKVAQAVKESGMDYTIFAPTGFFNDMAEFFFAAQKRGVIRLFGEGLGRINPLSSLDFGEEVARAILASERRNTVREVGGCETFTHRQIAELAFQSLDKEPRIYCLSPWVISLGATLLRPFNYNAYALFKFFEFIASTPDVTGEVLGWRRLEDFFANLAQGMSLVSAERALCLRRSSNQPQDSTTLKAVEVSSQVSQLAKTKLRARFEQFAQLRAKYGTAKAIEMLREGLPERQKTLMNPFIALVPLAEGFRRSIPIFEQLGMEMEVVDLSNQGKDGVLEIQRVCPYRELAAEFGLSSPCQITCDLEVEAIQQAFPDLKGRILSKLARGDCVCLFKYEREVNSTASHDGK